MKKVNYVIHQHDAYRAGKHYDLRIQYPKKRKALISFALPKSRFPDYGEKFLIIKTPDHSIDEWLGEHPPIEKGEYGGGTFKVVQKGELEILGWSGKHITFRIEGKEISGKFSLIKMRFGRKNNNWILIRSKEKENYIKEYVLSII